MTFGIIHTKSIIKNRKMAKDLFLSQSMMAAEFYKYTASLLPEVKMACVLDLGCGTGLELEEYFSVNPYAKVTGVDLTEAMLESLRMKFSEIVGPFLYSLGVTPSRFLKVKQKALSSLKPESWAISDMLFCDEDK